MTYSNWRGPDRPVSNGSAVTTVRLAPDDNAPAAARAALAPPRGQGAADFFERAELLVSEVVTSAARHGDGEIKLDIWCAGATVSVVASDDGPGFVATARKGRITET